MPDRHSIGGSWNPGFRWTTCSLEILESQQLDLRGKCWNRPDLQKALRDNSSWEELNLFNGIIHRMFAPTWLKLSFLCWKLPQVSSFKTPSTSLWNTHTHTHTYYMYHNNASMKMVDSDSTFLLHNANCKHITYIHFQRFWTDHEQIMKPCLTLILLPFMIINLQYRSEGEHLQSTTPMTSRWRSLPDVSKRLMAA